MPRIAAPELEDFDWFPVPLRDELTGLLRVASVALGVPAFAAPFVLEALEASGTNRIVDLCSGGGGPVVSLAKRLAKEHGRDVDVVLSDKFPNHGAFALAEAEIPGRVRGIRSAIDATEVPDELTGVRTIFNAFHHLPPPVARAVFADAAAKRQPILTFEFVERSPIAFATILGGPLGAYLMMPFVRPRTALGAACTYALPVIPAMALWDGFASCLRAYSVEELEELVRGLDTPDYRFRIEQRRAPGRPLRITSVIGLPTRHAR